MLPLSSAVTFAWYVTTVIWRPSRYNMLRHATKLKTFSEMDRAPLLFPIDDADVLWLYHQVAVEWEGGLAVFCKGIPSQITRSDGHRTSIQASAAREHHLGHWMTSCK